MKVTLVLKVSDANEVRFSNYQDCVFTRAVNRVLADGLKCECITSSFYIMKAKEQLYRGQIPGEFNPEDFQRLKKAKNDRKMRVDVPNEYLKAELLPAPKFDKYDLAINHLCGIKDRRDRNEAIADAWGNPVEARSKGGVLFSFLTECDAASNYSSIFRSEDGKCISTGCISQVAKYIDDTAPTKSLGAYIKAANVAQPEELRVMGVKSLRKALKKYADIQRAMDICFRFKPENAVKI